MTTQYLRFHSKHIGPILLEDKQCTARYNFNRELTVGDKIKFIDTSDRCFAHATVIAVHEMTVREFYKENPPGHKSYDSLSKLITELQTYYPDSTIDNNSLLTVCHWYKTTPTTQIQWYRKDDIQNVIDSLEKQLLAEDMTSASRDMIVERSFQRLRSHLDTLQPISSHDLHKASKTQQNHSQESLNNTKN